MALVSESTISMVEQLMEQEFDRCLLMDKTMRRNVARRLVEGKDFISDALGKYELDSLLRGHDGCGESQLDEVQRSIKLEMSLTVDQQNRLAAGNRDVRLLFANGITMPHAYYFAQRIVDTDRCLRALSHYGGEIGDIGGNYAAHLKQGRILHSCTLLNTAREAHRQKERDVRLLGDGFCLDILDRCTEGAACCSKKFAQSMSIHAITCIDADQWPEIMTMHACSYHVAVFHYDPVMLTNSKGFLPGREMYYEIRGEDVHFHFESDSSLGYVHPWRNFQRYVKPWCQFSHDKQWAYLYDLKTVGDGVATAEIVRVPASDLGVQIPKPLYAYVPNEQVVNVTTWFYDITSGRGHTDPLAFVQKTMAVSKDFYNFMYMYGISNDSANPNTPMTIKEFCDMAATYNSSRRFGDATLTRRCVSSLESEDVYEGMYHVMVRRRAVLAAKSAALTDSMMYKQRLAQLDVASVLLWLPLTAVGAATVRGGDTFSYYLRLASKAVLRACGVDHKLAFKTEPSSYIRLSDDGYRTFDGHLPDNLFSFDRSYTMVEREASAPHSPEVLNQLFEMSLSSLAEQKEYGDEVFLGRPAITKDVGENIVTLQAEQGTNAIDMSRLRGADVAVLSDQQCSDIEQSTAVSLNSVDNLNEDYRKKHVALMDVYNEVYRAGTTVKLGVRVTEDVDVVHEHATAAMVEFAVYSFDVGRMAVSTLRRLAGEVFVGREPSASVLNNLNDGSDEGVVVTRVVNGRLVDKFSSDFVAVDPYTGVLHQVVRGRDGVYAVRDLTVSYLVSANVTRVFNSYAIARQVAKAAASGWKPRFEMYLVDGVPGCGKTTEIVSAFTAEDVVLCAVKHSRDDTYERLVKKMDGVLDEKTCAARVRTLDSMIMHGFRAPGGVKTVFVDEALMAFPGQIYAALERLRPVSVRMYGDRFQIAAIDRSASMGSLRFQGFSCWTGVETRDVSYSMPADICVALSKKFYGRTIYTYSPVTRSRLVHQHKSVTDSAFVVAVPGVDVLSVLVADKQKMLCGYGFVDGKGTDGGVKGKSRVLTVHEAQGQRLEVVRIVRLNPNTAEVLNSAMHVTVGVSRHYLVVEYHKIGGADLMEDIMSVVVTDDEMRAVMKETPQWLLEKVQAMRARHVTAL